VISCTEAVRTLWGYLEGEVSPRQRAALEAHLDVCRRCCGEVEFVEELRGFLASAATVTLPQDVRARLEGFLEGM
jgi:anti-sigma factor (TIGR02949 family)